MVVEADESDGTFLKLPADVAIVTNIDPEHLDHFGTFDAVQEAFRAFVENVPFYGFAVMCIDHPEVQALVGRIEDRRIITYGDNPQADVRAASMSRMPTARRISRRVPRPRRADRARDRRSHAADARRAQRAERHRRDRGRARARHRRRRDPQGARAVRRRQAALHPHRRLERRSDRRRLHSRRTRRCTRARSSMRSRDGSRGNHRACGGGG